MKGLMGSLTSMKTIMGALKITGGLAAGFIGLPFLYRLAGMVIKPEDVAANRKYIGVAPLGLGLLMFGMLKNRDVKDIGLIIAAVGLYDLVQQNALSDYLPEIPVVGNKLVKQILPLSTDEEAKQAAWLINKEKNAAGTPLYASYSPGFAPTSRFALGASYQARRSPASAFAGTNPYEGVEGWQ